MAENRRLDFPPYALWETRAGEGTPIVLLHGLSGSTEWWGRNLEELSAQHLVAAVDLVGFGHNRRFLGPPAVIPPFGEVASLLSRWLPSFGERVHLVGHSMGGQIAIRLAAERPDLVRSLTLVNAAGMPFRLDPRPHIRSLPKPPYGGVSIARVLVPDFLRAGPASVAVAGTRVLFSDMRALMRRVRVPTLLVWGENDPLVPVEYGRAMQREIEGSRLVVLPRAAHVAMWDAPEAFDDELLRFIRDVESGPDVRPEASFAWGIAGWSEGVAHREAGLRRDIVLIHGLGMSSAYFLRLARALFERGWNPIAPDLPGFGESVDGPPAGPDAHADILAAWADRMMIRDAVWIGHSIGCNAVAALKRSRPELVRRMILLGPLWSATRHPFLRMAAMLALDAVREPLRLYRFVLPAYWRAGVGRWWRTWRRYVQDLPCSRVPRDAEFIAGRRDPLADRRCVTPREIDGAHACNDSHPEQLAEVVHFGSHPFTPS